MESRKPLLIGAAIVIAVGAALVVPAIASGATLPSLTTVDTDAGTDAPDSSNGDRKAWGHHKDDPDFPGNTNGKKSDDRPGNGNAWGHHKDDPDFPGNTNGKKSDDQPGNGNGKAWGHHKDDPDFPGNTDDDGTDGAENEDTEG